MRRRTRWILGAGLVALAGAAGAHVRLRHPGTGSALFWTTPSDVGIVINSTGSDSIADGSHVGALRLAIEAWNSIGGTEAQLVETSAAGQQARTDWQANDIHLILFDESNASGFFPGGSQTVAVTPIFFFGNGAIDDADVLFNGAGFDFTTSGEAGRYDVADVATHELGHLLGLDHSGWAGASMFPFVQPLAVLQRSPSRDEVTGLRDAYPSNGGFGRITGTVERESNGNPVAGAHVVARDAAGRTYASTITNDGGGFALRGLSDGTYVVYAHPLDEPVSGANFVGGQTIQTNFAAAFYGSSATVSGGDAVDLGTLVVPPPIALNLGRITDALPKRGVIGSTVARTLGGSGLVVGSTIESSDPNVVVSPTSWLGTQVMFLVTVPPGTPIGHVDLTVTDPSGDIDVLPAAIELTPPNPTVSDVSPGVGAFQGGTALTITGTGLRPGARVVIGERVYTDGDDATVVNDTTIQLTTGATAAGTYDVVVVDASGVEGRGVGAFVASANPAIDSVFPPAGAAAGGTELVVRGAQFMAGAVVRIDGIEQSGVAVDSAKRVRVTTEGGLPGGPYMLEVENPGGGLATSSFVYAAQADPALAAIAPAQGKAEGGRTVTISGSGFTADSRVFFGVAKDTGLGGIEAASVTFVDAGTLTVTTPAHAAGQVHVLVRDDVTQQASVLASAFTFNAASTGGGGGGGCHAAGSAGDFRASDALLGSWWLIALLVVLGVRARTPAARRAS